MSEESWWHSCAWLYAPSSGSLVPKGQGRAPIRSCGEGGSSFVLEVSRRSCMLQSKEDGTLLAAFTQICLHPTGMEKRTHGSSSTQPVHTCAEAGDYLILLHIRVLLAQEEAEWGAHRLRGLLIGKVTCRHYDLILPTSGVIRGCELCSYRGCHIRRGCTAFPGPTRPPCCKSAPSS